MNNASLELGGTNWAEKDGNILGYSVGDTSGKYSPQEFTFARGSNLSATRIDRAGLIVKGRENVLTYSNDFSFVDWLATSSSFFTSGQVGYDDSSDAWLFTANAAGERIQRTINESGVYTLSAYFKKGTADGIRFRVDMSGSDANVYVNLIDGSLINSNGIIANKITDVGNGWYRVELVANWVSVINIRVYPSNTSGVNIAGTILIQDAQLEQGLAASPYIETTTTSAQAGVLENTPRLNYTTGVANPYLLLEPSRTNILTQSEYLDSSDWPKTNVSVTSNAANSPEGLQNASKLIPANGTGGNRSISKNYVSLTGLHTFSVFAKAAEYGYISLRMRNSPNDFAMFDLTNGLVHATNTNAQMVSGSPKIEDYGNGWYRCSIVIDPSGSTSAGQVYASYSVGITGNETSNFSGDGVSGIYIYGSQLEAGSYPTSYIPTYSVSATRAEDDMDTTFSSPLATNGSATIFFHELGVADSDDIKTTGGAYRYQKDTSNYVSLTTTATLWRVRVQGGGTSNFKGLNNNPKTSPIKVAIVVTSSTFSVYANGVKELDNSSLSSTADFSSINDFITIIAENIGVRKSVQHLVFPTALSDADAITLTTI